MGFAYSTTSLQLEFLAPVPVDGRMTLRRTCHRDPTRTPRPSPVPQLAEMIGSFPL